ncbi:MAG: peptidyl-prolyl cis-trans isomerase, partial [Alphaproteobacteria bacterium]|nr:peptidyl-prolyl cis-trans isomerase [Alphaproteobacteria bacterium]
TLDRMTLAAWFDTTKSGYRAPEYRSFNYVKLEPADIADTSAITDEQIREDYERRKATYEIAGTRTIEQLSFENREVADAALSELQNGTSFDQLVSDQGKTAGDVLLGEFTRDRLPDPALAEAAFAVTTEGGTTPVVDGALGPVILRISNIKDGRTQSLDEVKEEIRTALAEAAVIADITTVHDQFEDLRAGGSTLKEAADQLRLKTATITDIDRRGLDNRETEIAGIPERDKLLTEVFRTDIGVEALPVNLGNNGFIWFDVTDIKPERDRELAEVREKAVADWTAEQQRIALGALAESLRKRIADGGKLEDIASELGIAVESKAGITRRSEDAVLGPAAVTAAFSGPQGTVATASGADPSTQILLSVTAVRDQPTGGVPLSEDQQIGQLANAAGDDILDQMVSQLQAEYGVVFNQALAQQAIVR